ncbi:MAG TPA: NAD-dependent epimerase/dehydratase family protein [Pseudothermotoga sp.]|nr:NAD-dependent epimerase/dehydratase family protein [Pseudothermotoga sp.]HOK83154.1 NAD-dependent epimerase/dehydratase family protein [Pseudothermotoga sp.]HPP69675.1 NAD-dependent epimerase/dehydratase family protein [Pseudothermotoga sp.]
MILVTGSTGHLGNVLVRLLVASGQKVKAMVAPFEDAVPLEGLPVEVVRGDIRDQKFVEDSCKGVETVYHLAAVISILGKKKVVYDVNVGGTENVIYACKKNNVHRLVYVSSIHALCELKPGSLVDESVCIDPNKTVGDYAKSKAIATLEILKSAKQGLNAIVVCPTGIVGPYDWRVSEMGNLLLLYSRNLLKVGVEGSFDFVDVRDVANLLIQACGKASSGELFIASGQYTTIRAFIQMLQRIRPHRSVNVFLPRYVAYPVSLITSAYYLMKKKKPLLTPYSIHTLTRNYVYSHQKATIQLGYNPRPLVDSLRDAMQWFEDNGYVRPINAPLTFVERSS